jgi:hypothetical protein
MWTKFKLPQTHVPHMKCKQSVKRQITVPQPLEKKVIFDREITEFEVRVAISTSVLVFSMGMLVTKRGDPGMYLPIVTSILGYWTPSPTKKKDDDAI